MPFEAVNETQADGPECLTGPAVDGACIPKRSAARYSR